ncbi:hypothetical protein BFW01_g1717 [Lasiodiplodia theobromae]|nr:hypothetical protein BFW01_g1717 [Lasiodiplodia theobromae]
MAVLPPPNDGCDECDEQPSGRAFSCSDFTRLCLEHAPHPIIAATSPRKGCRLSSFTRPFSPLPVMLPRTPSEGNASELDEFDGTRSFDDFGGFGPVSLTPAYRPSASLWPGKRRRVDTEQDTTNGEEEFLGSGGAAGTPSKGVQDAFGLGFSAPAPADAARWSDEAYASHRGCWQVWRRVGSYC